MEGGRIKPGEVPPRYDEVALDSAGGGFRESKSGGGGGLWDVRSWSKKVWIGLAAVIVIAIVIGVAVGVTQGKKGSSYPDYSQLTYTLKDTCK